MKVVRENERELVLDTGEARLAVKDGIISFVSSDDSPWGWKNFSCETTLSDDATISSASEARLKSRRRLVGKMGHSKEIRINYEKGALAGEVILTLFEDFPILFLQHNRTNRGESAIDIRGLVDVVVDGGSISSGEAGFFISTENIKTYTLFNDITTRNELFLPLPKETLKVGLSEDFPFTAIFFGSRKKTISVSMKSLRLNARKTYLIENFWTRKRRRVRGKVSFSLRPHESVLFHIYE